MTNTETVGTEHLETELREVASWLLNSRFPGNEHIAVRAADKINRAADALASRTQSPAEWRTDVHDGAAACHVMAARWDEEGGEWIVDIVMAPPGKPWTHWRHLGPMPDAALRAASIPAPERSKEETGVRVKPLEWMLNESLSKWRGWGAFGEFTSISTANRTDEQIEAAKAEADREYAASILSALHKEGEAVYFAEGNTVRKRVGSAFGEGDVLFCTPSAWFPANEVADLLNAAPVLVPVTITDEDWLRRAAMDVMLATEVEEATRILKLALSAPVKPGEQG